MILEVKDIVTTFDTDNGTVRAVDHVSFDLKRGETLGIVGESGSGKSVTSLSLMRLLPKPAGQTPQGEVIFHSDEGAIDILKLSKEKMRTIRGNKISMIFQEPLTALNPVYSVGKQLMEVYEIHFPKMKKAEMITKAIEMLRKVGIPAPEQRIAEYPHQLSGGMRQRVMIAIALACEPDILICDEPTTALDVTIQAQILELIKELQTKNGMSVMMITHDLGVIAEICDRVVVMYAGRVAEVAPVNTLFEEPRHAYTKALLKSIPKLDSVRKTKLDTIPGMVPALADMPEGCRFAERSGFEHSEESLSKRAAYQTISEGHVIEACPCCQKALAEEK